MMRHKHPIGTKVVLIQDKENIAYWRKHFGSRDYSGVFEVVGHHMADGCVNIDDKGKVITIGSWRFKKHLELFELHEDLFTL